MEPMDSTHTVRKILVIDDDPETANLARAWFHDASWEILDAATGEEGLRLVTEIRPDLILLDLRMPGMDGIAVARKLKEEPTTHNVPIVLLTACRDLDAKVAAFRAGADDYVTKPFEFAEVDVRIRSMLRRRELSAGLETRVQQLTAANMHLEKLLMVDEKTGLYNFREFRRRLMEEGHRAERYGAPLSLILLDIDHFKQINDTLGHPAGDSVLREFGTLVSGGARANDVAARYGGEEFAVILPHTESCMALRVAKRIASAVREFTFLAGEHPTRITVSAGVATYPSAGVDSLDGLLRVTDGALYEAKQAGRDRVMQAGLDRTPHVSNRRE